MYETSARTDHVQPNPGQPPQALHVTSAANYFDSGQFDTDIAAFRNGISTGFADLDKNQLLCPGVYVLGGGPGAGKTAFCLQMADNMAAGGNHVLYVSLALTQVKLFCQTLSRRLFMAHVQDIYRNRKPSGIPLYTGAEIRTGAGYGTEHQKRVISDYGRAVGGRLAVMECAYDTMAETIQANVEQYVGQTGIKPIVFIDSLLDIAPSAGNGFAPGGKHAIDHAMRVLRNMQQKLDLTVIVLTPPIDVNGYFGPGFGSGNGKLDDVGPMSDVTWNLRMAAVRGESGTDDLEYLIKTMTGEDGSTVQLMCCRNRFGRDGYAVELTYYPRYGAFLSRSDLKELAEQHPESGT